MDKDGKALVLTQNELVEAEDELIRIMHKRFLDGQDDEEFFDYKSVDNDDKYDDKK